MINNVVLVGRLTKEIELRKTQSNVSTCTFTLACDKRFKPTQEGMPTADFIQCVAWRQSADFLNQYALKGSIVSVEGSIQTRNYEGQNGRVYVTEVLADRVRLIGGQQSHNKAEEKSLEQKVNEFIEDNDIGVQEQDDYHRNNPTLDIASDDLPFY